MTPVVLLHGVPTSAAIWGGVIDALRRETPGRRVIAPDLPGFGEAAPLATPTVEAMGEWLEEALAGVGPAHLVGHDYGGLLALRYAARRPTRSLTLTSTARGWGWLPAVVTARPPWNRWFYRRHEGRLWLDRGVSAPRRAELRALFPPCPGPYMEAIALGMQMGEQHRLTTETPTLCLWGEADTSIRPAYGRHLARALGARFEALPGGRHYTMWEDPGGYAAALARFWAAVGG